MSPDEPRALEFLAGSNALDGVHDDDDGHARAFRASQEAARQRRALTLEELCTWQRLIAGPDELRGGDVVAAWLADLNAALASAGQFESDVVVAEILGDFVHRFESLRPLAGTGGRVARLVANYIATWFARPLLVFRADERAAYATARSSSVAMRCLMADKLRETVVDWFGSGAVLQRTRIGSNADIYERPAGGVLIIERHDLLAARARWLAPAGS